MTISFEFVIGTIKVPFLATLLSIGILLWIAENIGIYYAHGVIHINDIYGALYLRKKLFLHIF